jgi:hypothetical protein
VHQKRATLRGPSSRTGNFLVTESLAVMAMEYLVLEVKYLVKLGFERLKFMVKVERKELEIKMSYGDKRLKDDVASVEE